MKNDDFLLENDSENASFLLAASFIGLVSFQGSFSDKNTLFWKFSPKDKALELISQFQTRTEPHIPAKNLFEASSAFWSQVSRSRKLQKEGRENV